MPDPGATVAARPSDLSLLWRQFRAQNKLFLRNPFSAFFSLAFPVMFLLLFGSLNGSGRIPELNNIRYIQFLAPGMLAFAVISTCYTGLVTGVAINRDEGLLKRVRGTPLPPWVYITARIASAVFFSLVSAVVMVVAAVLLFQVEVIGRMLPAAAVTLLGGAACFCAMGMAVAAVIPNGEAAPVIANFTFFPVAFVSDLFFPTAGAPAWVGTVGSIFPVKHFALALEDTFNPFVQGSGFQLGHLGVMALWTGLGVVVAVRFFRWEPKAGASGGRRRRSGRAAPVAEADPTA
jgi:ABC-2 type transport system permease protein